MKKLPIVLVISSAAINCNNMDPFEQFHKNIRDQIKAFNEAFDKMFEPTSSITRSKQESAIKQLDLENKENSIEIKLEFNSEPKGSIEAQKKGLKGSFEVDGDKIDLSIEKNKAYRYLDGSSWVLSLKGHKQQETKRTLEPKDKESKPEEQTYVNHSSYSSTQTIQAELDDLKNASVVQAGNTVTIVLPKKASCVRKINLQQSAPANEESTPIEIAKKNDSDGKELA